MKPCLLDGVGKTELATQYSLLHLLLNTYPGGICWLRARDEDIGIQILRFVEAKLGIKPPEDWDIKSQIDFCWSRWQEKKEGNVLIVLDDVNDYPKIQSYLPPQLSQFKVLITTRLQLDLPQSFPLDILSESASLELLRQWIGEEKVNEQLADAKELCLRLGYLPLALNLVGRYVKKRKISLAEMLRRLEQKGLQHQALDIDKKDRTRTLNIQRGVAAAFELSWEELSEDAQKLGCLLSLFALAPISWNLVEKVKLGLDNEELEDARIELENLHLLKFEEDCILHQLIREYFQEKLQYREQQDELKAEYTKTMVAILEQNPGLYSITREYIKSLQPSVPHLLELAENLNTYIEDKNLGIFFNALEDFYQSQGLYNQAELIIKNGIKITQERFKYKNLDVAGLINNLALLYWQQNQYDKAEPLFLESLELRKNLSSEKSPEVAQSLNNLALLYEAQARYDEAEPLYLKALELWKLCLGAEHTEIANTLNNIAWLYRSQGRYSEAEPIYIEALELRKRLLGEEHPHVADTLNKLAELYLYQGRYSEAEPLFIDTLELRKRLLGEEHPDIAESLNNLAEVYRYQNRNGEAEPLFLEALELRRNLFGENNSYVATCLNNLAALYSDQGRYSEAEPIYIKTLELWKSLLGEKHPNVGITLNNLAKLYSDQGRNNESQSMYLKALEVFKNCLGEEHPYVGITGYNLAQQYEVLNNSEKALAEYIKSLEIFQAKLGFNHPITTSCRKKITSFLKKIIKKETINLDEIQNNPTIKAIFSNLQESIDKLE